MHRAVLASVELPSPASALVGCAVRTLLPCNCHDSRVPPGEARLGVFHGCEQRARMRRWSSSIRICSTSGFGDQGLGIQIGSEHEPDPGADDRARDR